MRRVKSGAAVINRKAGPATTRSTSLPVSQSRGSSKYDDLAPHGEFVEVGRFGRGGGKLVI